LSMNMMIFACVNWKTPLYPSSILAMSAASTNDDALRCAEEAAIPEFKRFNIIESDIRNVI